MAYFTIVPAGRAGAPGAAAAAWLPIVGGVTGALSGALAQLVAHASLPLAVAAAFAASIVLTGAIHVDGFADACDALFAPVPPARRFEILKDPHHGTFAVAGVAAVASLWLGALASRPDAIAIATIAVAAIAARCGAVASMRGAVHARGADAPPAFHGAPSLPVLALGFIVLAVVVAFSSPSRIAGCVEAASGIVVAVLAVAWARRRLGGRVAGDVYGFAIVLGEVAALAAFAVTRP